MGFNEEEARAEERRDTFNYFSRKLDEIVELLKKILEKIE